MSENPETNPIETIMVATSLEAESDAVVRAGRDLAARIGAALTVFHAMPLPSSFYAASLGMATIDAHLLEHQQEQCELEAEAQFLRVGGGPPDPAIRIEVGPAHRLILDAAESCGADLVVLGDRESQGPWTPVIGSTTDRVLRRIDGHPVLVVRDGLAMPPARALAPVDLAESTVPALRRGLALLDAWSGGAGVEVEALFVVGDPGRHAGRPSTEEIERVAAEALDRLIAEARAGFVSELHSSIRFGRPRQQILEHLSQRDFDLVMLECRGRSRLDRVLLGSVGLSISHHAPVSVLYLPSTKVESEGA